ncbi:MAG: lysoplasmalogenase [Oscillospiraceae bacterium]|nr:lysoplasmalogenase [Oscillospiraceae bacterium]
MHYILALGCALMAIPTAALSSTPHKVPRLICKMIAASLFLAAGFVAAAQRTGPADAAITIMLVGLGLGWLGDLLLGFDPFVRPENKNKVLVSGGIPFFLGHVAYIIVLATITPLNLWLLPLLLVLPLLILIMHRVFDLEKMLVPFLGYSLMLGAMMMFTLNVAIEVGGPLGRLMILPGVLFAVSDSVLFLNKKIREKRGQAMPVLHFVCLIPYFSAQALFALSIAYMVPPIP